MPKVRRGSRLASEGTSVFSRVHDVRNADPESSRRSLHCVLVPCLEESGLIHFRFLLDGYFRDLFFFSFFFRDLLPSDVWS